MRGNRDMSYFACHVEKFKSNDVRGLQIHNQRESSNSKNNDIDPSLIMTYITRIRLTIIRGLKKL
mgnify:CR=1 FL=1